jgi:hypothetical protein
VRIAKLSGKFLVGTEANEFFLIDADLFQKTLLTKPVPYFSTDGNEFSRLPMLIHNFHKIPMLLYGITKKKFLIRRR